MLMTYFLNEKALNKFSKINISEFSLVYSFKRIFRSNSFEQENRISNAKLRLHVFADKLYALPCIAMHSAPVISPVPTSLSAILCAAGVNIVSVLVRNAKGGTSMARGTGRMR